VAKPPRASKKDPCPKCGKRGWPCYVLASREVAYCETVTSDATDKKGLYRHFLVERDRSDWKPRPARKAVDIINSLPTAYASPDHLNLVYGSLLAPLGLSDERRDGLFARGLHRRQMYSAGYRDTPSKEEAQALVDDLVPLGLEGVPGFHRRGGRWRIAGTYPGFFVPYMDVRGRVLGLSYRLDVPLVDEKGKVTAKYLWLSSDPEARYDDGGQKFPGGTRIRVPLHFARPELIPASPDILLTEGSLKSQIAAELLGLPFIGAGGVDQWGEGFAEQFKRMFPGKRAVVCYDSDWRSNEHVRRALEKLMADLRDAGVRYVVRSWPQHEAKGIDDLALALSQSNKGVRAA
jgi:DNA primase